METKRAPVGVSRFQASSQKNVWGHGMPVGVSRLQLQPGVDDAQDGQYGGRQPAQPHKARVGLEKTQLVQRDKKVTGVLGQVKQKRRVAAEDVYKEAELEDHHLLVGGAPTRDHPVLSSQPGGGTLAPSFGLHQEFELVEVPAEIHDERKQVIPKGPLTPLLLVHFP